MEKNVEKLEKRRYVELDFFRGIALLMMLLSNFITDLQYFAGYSDFKTFWRFFALTTASMFVFISGVSLWIAHFKYSFKHYFKRFLKLFGLGIAITAVTYFFLEEGTIYFGVLHFLGIASILSIPFFRFGPYNLIFALIFISGKFLVDDIHNNSLIFLPLGITPVPFFTFDYFPIFPWFGVFLAGVGTGSLAYSSGRIKFQGIIPSNKITKFIALAGRHTLKVYLIHQPVFATILWLILGDLRGVEIL